MFVAVRLENRDGHHNKFYEMTLTGAPSTHTKIEIHSGRIGKTNVTQQPKETEGGWSDWSNGFEWFSKQLKQKVGDKKEYEIRSIKASADAIESEVQSIADRFSSDRKKIERFENFLTTHWW